MQNLFIFPESTEMYAQSVKIKWENSMFFNKVNGDV